jgi:hypothetical protein
MSVLDAEDGPEVSECRVTAHRSSPDRIVFTEEDNTDGWIATDYTEPLEP